MDSTLKKVLKGAAITVTGGVLVLTMLPTVLSLRLEDAPRGGEASLVSVRSGVSDGAVEIIVETAVGTVRLKLGAP